MIRNGVKYLMVGATCLVSGIGIAMVAQDLAGIAYAPIDPNEVEKELDYNNAAQLVQKLIESGKLSPEQILELIEQYPELSDMLLEYAMEAMAASLSNMKDEDNGIEPDPSMAATVRGKIDDGTLDPESYEMAKKIFSVKTPYQGTVYLRAHSLGDFDPTARRWGSEPSYDGSFGAISPADFRGAALSFSGASKYKITISLGSFRDYGTIVPDYAYYKYQANEHDNEHLFSRLDENRIHTLDLDSYVTSFYPDVNAYASFPGFVQEDEAAYISFAKRNYLAYPESEDSILEKFLSSHKLGTPERVISYLSNPNYFTYEYGVATPGDQDFVDYFLNTSRRGTCTNFATAATLLIRKLGVPARFVEGYMAETTANIDTDIRGKDAHAWVEIYESGKGWKRMDPTPSGGTLSGDQVEPSANAGKPIVDDGTYDSHEHKNDLFSYKVTSGSYSGDLYFRSTAYNSYDTSSHTWSYTAPERDGSSLLAGNPGTVPGSAINLNMSTLVNIQTFSGFSDNGFILPDYAYGYVARGAVSDPESLTSQILPYDDVRFPRLGLTSYTAAFTSTPFGSELPDGYASYASSYYKDVPSELTDLLNNLISSESLNSVSAIGDYLERFHYQEKIATDSAMQGKDPLFKLLDVHKGTSSNFATLAVMLLRSTGYPARLVEGYYDNTLNGTGTITEANRAYWAEYFDGGKWVRFDHSPKPGETLNISISCNGGSVTYDGQAHFTEPSVYEVDSTGSSFSLKEEKESRFTLKGSGHPGDFIVLTPKIAKLSISNAGDWPVAYTAAVTDYWGEDVTSLYTLSFDSSTDATNTISKREITLKAKNLVITSQEEFDECSANLGIMVYVLEEKPDLANGDSIHITYGLTSLAKGSNPNRIISYAITNAKGEDVTSNYAVTVVDGVINVDY